MIKEFNVTGMSCAACVQNVEKTVSKLKGASNVNVNLISSTMTVDCSTDLTESDVIKAVESIGYGASVKGDNTSKSSSQNKSEIAWRDLKNRKNRLIASLLLLIPLFYITMGAMVGLKIPPIIDGQENALIYALVQLLLTSIILLINKSFFIRGTKALIKRVPNMDSLIAIGSGAAYVYGLAIIFILAYGFGHSDLELVHKYLHSLYFESSATIVTLVSLGKYFENRAKIKTNDEINKLMELAPKTCVVLRDGKEITVEASALVIGDKILIRPGDTLPVDGKIIEGVGLIDQSAITGESLPVQKGVGDEVISATINKNGTFVFEASKVGSETTIAKIVELVERASNSKAPIAKIADKVSGVFVPIVLMISLCTLIIWFIASRDIAFSLNFAISVLVISCPCALGLATPLAIMVATGKAAKYGILIKDAQSLENLGKADTIIFDKTGTVTVGRLVVTDVISFEENISNDELIAKCAAIERLSQHPLAKAITQYGNDDGVLAVTDFVETAGKGTSGVIGGKKYRIGNIKMFDGENVENLSHANKVVDELASQGKTAVLCACENVVIGVVAMQDEIRQDSKQAIEKLRAMGMDVVMLTGDSVAAANAIKDKVKIDTVIANVLPDEKYAYVEKYKKIGRTVVMVGDGINDSPALKSADIGVAIGSGTDIAIESASIVLIKNSLGDLVTAIMLSRRTISDIMLSLFWAFFYNTLGIPLAAGVFFPIWGLSLNPMIGSLAMSLSSVCVVLNALSLKFFNENGKIKKFVKIKENNMEKVITIEGMMCSHCQAKVQKTLSEIKGVGGVVVDLEKKQATVSMEKEIKDKVFEKSIEKIGYKVIDIK